MKHLSRRETLALVGSFAVGVMPKRSQAALPQITVGRREVLMGAEDRISLGLTQWPDGSFGYVQRGHKLQLYAANSGQIAKVEHDVTKSSFKVVYARKSIESIRTPIDYAGGGPVIETGNGLLLIYHAERHVAGNSKRFYSSLGLARSSDDGATFHDLGEFIRPSAPWTPDLQSSVEVEGGSIVRRHDRTFIFYNDQVEGSTRSYLAKGRASDNPEQVGNWRKYYNGSFSEPSLGGRFSPSTFSPAWSSVAQRKNSDELLVAFALKRGDRYSIGLATSQDGLCWSEPVILESEVREAFYPTIIDPTTSMGQVDDKFFVYYTVSNVGAWDRWTDAVLVRRSIVLGTG